MAMEVIKRNPLVAAQLILYSSICFCGFFICIPFGMTMRNFHGSCLLFGQVVWDGRFIWPWAESTCEFVLYTNLGVNIIYCCMMGLFMLLVIWPRTGPKHYEKVEEAEKWNLRHAMSGLYPVMCFINLILFVLLLCASSTLSAGFAYFCNWLMSALKKEGTDLEGNCARAQGLNWDEFQIRGGTSRGIRGNHFYDAVVISITFSWIAVILWLILLCISFSQICRRCSCEVAEEKKKWDKSAVIAARRSRLATPIGTPGGMHTPIPTGAPMPPQQPYRPPQHGQLNPQMLMGPPQQQRFPQGQFR